MYVHNPRRYFYYIWTKPKGTKNWSTLTEALSKGKSIYLYICTHYRQLNDYNARRAAYVLKRDTQERLLKSVRAHRSKMTKLVTLAETFIGICEASPSRRATQELEKVKRELDDKCLDMEAGLYCTVRFSLCLDRYIQDCIYSSLLDCVYPS